VCTTTVSPLSWPVVDVGDRDLDSPRDDPGVEQADEHEGVERPEWVSDLPELRSATAVVPSVPPLATPLAALGTAPGAAPEDDEAVIVVSETERERGQAAVSAQEAARRGSG